MVLGWNIFPYVAAVAVLLSVVAAIFASLDKERGRRIAIASAIGGIAILAAFVAMLWLTLERPPLRTMGETRLWYSLFLLLSGLITYVRWRYRWIMGFSTMLATVFMIINIAKPELHDHTLMPALQSPWFVPHVSVYMFSYALLGCATLLSAYGLWRPSAELDKAINRVMSSGIAFFTIGMFSGALWAKEAWGTYWNWDPKEAWAAATWGLYLLALHIAPQRRRIYYAIVIAAFLSLQMCWWGVNYLPNAERSEHTYTMQR